MKHAPGIAGTAVLGEGDQYWCSNSGPHTY
jgi:hypothetical protein